MEGEWFNDASTKGFRTFTLPEGKEWDPLDKILTEVVKFYGPKNLYFAGVPQMLAITNKEAFKRGITLDTTKCQLLLSQRIQLKLDLDKVEEWVPGFTAYFKSLLGCRHLKVSLLQ